MFNKKSFNKILFNRSRVDAPPLSITLAAKGQITLNLNFRINLNSIVLKGQGELETNAIIYQLFDPTKIDGVSDLIINSNIAFPAKFNSVIFSGLSELEIKPIYSVPIPISTFKGVSVFQQINSFIIGKHTFVKFNGVGLMESKLVFPTNLSILLQTNRSRLLADDLFLEYNIQNTKINGSGSLSKALVIENNEVILQLNNVNLKTGETIIIDTDTLEVWVRGILDVNTVSSDSTFFELSPGTNKIKIQTPGQYNFINTSVEVMWNNRWL